MEVKNKFNTVKIATCNDAHKAEAVSQLFERSLLFNRSDDICGIVISKNDEKQFIPISAIPDNVNIEKRDGVVTLVENPVVDSITTKADHNGIDWKSQHKIAETSAERTIILLCTKNIEDATNIGVIGGEILEVGEGVYGNYKISLTPTGSGLLIGATTFEQKAALVRAKYNGTYYYGIKFKSTVPANIYFSGWDHFPEGADAPLYTSYTDADLSEIIELGGGDSGGSSGGGMTEAEKVEINGKIDALQGQVASAIVSIDGIEQKLSEIFSAESKVTDFNTTTNSGIYYWVNDAANKPGTDYGVLLVNKYDGGSTTSIWINQIAYGTNGKIYFRQNINSGSWTEWKAVAFDGEITAKKVANALTVNGKTYDGSSAVDAGVQTVANGGTGATDAASGFNTLADGVRDSSTPRDDEKMLLKPSGPWYKTTCLDFWNYIKGKISSVLGLTKDTYGGKASTAGTADRAIGIDYTGESVSCISAAQTPESYNNSSADWASYIICNHGNGKTYYHQMLRLPFFSDTIQLQRRVNGELQGWKNVAIMENENTWSGRQNFTTAKASNKMVIPIGAPSNLEDGCIWIQ